MGVGIGGTGAATMPRPGGAMGGMPGADNGEKKKIDPKLFFVGGGLLFAAIIGLFTTGVIGGSTSELIIPFDASAGTTGRSSVGTGTSISVPAPPPPAPSGPSGNTNEPPAQQQQKTQFSTIVPPNPKFTTATLAIAPAQPVSEQEAVQGATDARQHYMATGRWSNTQIFVFADSKSGQAFSQYMNARRGQPLTSDDYAMLAQQGAWTNATVFYESLGKQGKGNVRYPYKSPKSWWG